MKINWKIRFKNPLFWAHLAVAIILPILAYMGLNWSDLTTWTSLFKVLLNAIKNPVIVVSVLVSVYNYCIDPTTPGERDSDRALKYTKPGGGDNDEQ